jgi:hypothetical protein
VTILEGVDTSGVSPSLWLYLGTIAFKHRQHTGRELTITSLRRPPGPRPSKHSPPDGELVEAADIRRWLLDELGEAAIFARKLQALYGSELGVVLEPEWLTPDEVAERGGLAAIGPHIHVQLKSSAWPRLV